MRKMPPLNAIRAFEAAARNNSFSAAAVELCVTVTAISHQIRHLEDQIGRKLFERTPRAVMLTATGERLYPPLRDGFNCFAEAFDELEDRSKTNSLTLTTTRAFAERWLMPRLDNFSKLFPEVNVNVEGFDQVIDLHDAGIDVAIRYGRTMDGKLQSTILLKDTYHAIAVASPRAGDVPPIEEFKAKSLLAYRWHRNGADVPTWAKWMKEAGRAELAEYRLSWFNDESLAMHAMERGFGPLLCSNALVDNDIKTGRLVRIDGPALEGFDYRIAHVPNRKLKRSVSLFMDWVRAEADEFSLGL